MKSNLIKNAYPLFLINEVTKKYLDYEFSSNQNQLKDKSEVHYFKAIYQQPFTPYQKQTFETLQRVLSRKF